MSEIKEGSSIPLTSNPLISMCDANQGASSSFFPVRTLQTPCGRSLVAITSAKVIAESGARELARTMHVFPETMIGAIASTSPNKELSSGAMDPTTPIASGMVKL